MHQLHTSLDNESAATSSNTAKQGPGFEHTAKSSIQLARMVQSCHDLPQYRFNTARPIVRRAGVRTRDSD
jgi:hypothetical protein